MDAVRLNITLHSFWVASSGEGAGYGSDRNVRRDRHGLPFIPGRTLKGLLRDGVRDAESLRWYATDFGDQPGSTETLFGSRADEGDVSTPGLLRVAGAQLPQALRAYLGADSDEARTLREGLYRTLYSVAINEEGVAVDRALRSGEVVVPLALQATVSVLPERLDAQNPVHARWREVLERALPLIRGVGSGRRRGLGRAEFHLEGAA